MIFSSLAFASPLLLLALLALPLLWWLLRLTPPKPVEEVFPPIQILKELEDEKETPASTPWWLILLRMMLAALIIFALAEPIWNPSKDHISGQGRLLVIMDNSWGSATHWQERKATAKLILEEGEGRPVSFVTTIHEGAIDLTAGSAFEAQKILAAAEAFPIAANFDNLIKAISADRQSAPSHIVWIGNGLDHPQRDEIVAALKTYQAEEMVLYQTNQDELVVITQAQNNSDALEVTLKRAQDVTYQQGNVEAFDQRGRILGEAPFEFDEGSFTTLAKFKLPVELRNEILRIGIHQNHSVGGSYLVDGRFQRKRVGLISGEKNDLAQPLLSSLYYIDKALVPFSEVVQSDNVNLIEAIPNVIAQKPSMIVLADIGTVPTKAQKQLQDWIKEGGTLVRFAGKNLAASENQNELLPVRLRKGERQLSGSLTWGEPQKLANFNNKSPFGTLTLPDDVSVKRQVLAEPDLNLADKTWASLEDGTPLVTAKALGRGRIILFHVTADVRWSNLPLSGTFVEMLRSITVSSKAVQAQNFDQVDAVIQPYKMLDAQGKLVSPAQFVKPLNQGESIKTDGDKRQVDTLDNPPGLYGISEAFIARNLLSPNAEIRQTGAAFLSAFSDVRSLITKTSIAIKPWLLVFAAFLFILDCLLMIFLRGKLRLKGFGKPKMPKGAGKIAASLMVTAFISGLTFLSTNLLAQEPSKGQESISEITERKDFQATLKTRIAYVITNNLKLDDISHQGLIGLTDAITERTALEPDDPVGVNLEVDELNFYPLIYWPIDGEGEVPSAKTMAKVDAYMKQGGTVLFDTRDALVQNGINGTSREKIRLQQILSSLDIPPLAPVSQNHVLTRTFYLLDRFPGLYRDGDLWVEALPNQEDGEQQITKVGDGVSSIMITSNDFASAWAVDENGRFMFPTVPPSAEQRTYAFRTGINIVMYTLTGNYKADQVHIPALLERLGQ